MKSSAAKLLALAVIAPVMLTSPTIFSASDDRRSSEALLLSKVRQLTFVGRRSGEGYFDATGARLIFQSEREPDNPFFQIYSMDLGTGKTRRLSPGYGKATCAWIHPEGTSVLFSSTHEDPEARAKQQQELDFRASGQTRRYSWDFDDNYEIYQMDLESGSLQDLTRAHGYDAEASWSPDGRSIVFASNRHAYAGGGMSRDDQAHFARDKSYMMDLYLMRADGSGVERLTETPGYDGGPFFSSDGREVCWRRFSKDGATAEIYTMDLSARKERQLTRLGALSWAPFFHPSGEYLIFATNLHGFDNFELYLVDARGLRDPVRVTDTEGFDGLPAFHPDGTQLAWTSNRAGNRQSQLFLAQWNHEKARELLGLARAGLYTPRPAAGGSVHSAAEKTTPELSVADLRMHVEQLSSERMAGRLTGTTGARLAGEYVSSVFQSLGLEPAGDDGTYFQTFEFTAGVSLGGRNQLSVIQENSLAGNPAVDQEWRPLAFSAVGEFGPAAVVFGGYGIAAPAAEGLSAYDSYVHLDVKDKWVLAFRYVPEQVPAAMRRHLLRHAAPRYKAMVARDREARGLILVSGPNSKVREELIPLSMDASVAAGSIPVLSVTDALAREWIGRSGKTIKDLQDQLDQGKAIIGFEIPELSIEAVVDIRQEKRTGRNVLALLRNSREQSPRSLEAPVIIGAHLDHLGDGRTTGSLAREDEKGRIHYGADDNASGVAVLLEVAQLLADQRSQGKLTMTRDLILAAWSGEELGLLGSNHYVEARSEGPHTASLNVAAYLNLDMVGRLEDKLVLQGVGSSSVWLEEIERGNAPVGLSLAIQNETYLPTDTTAFYLKRVPILSAFTGAHDDYHTPRDTVEKINYEGTREIAHLMARITSSLLAREEAPDYQEMRRPEHLTQRAHLRAYLGTIPDYSEGDVSGVRLSGVAKGGPAEEAGVRSGDLIVELAGKKIENIYDYTYAIEALKIGEPVEIVLIRGGDRVILRVVPGSRE